MLTFPTHPEAPPLESLCQISDRLGCLKIEKSGIVKFFSQAAKTYSYETLDGEITLKAKGFNLLEKLLKDNGKEKILETNLTEMFSGLSEMLPLKVKNTVPVKIFQKQIRVNPLHMVPALLPKPKSYKMLNFIGPRRQIDIDRWLEFKFERVKVFEGIQIDPLEAKGQTNDNKDLTVFSCDKKMSLERVSNTKEKYQVRLVPTLKGVLPALPFGFDVSNLEKNLKFYALIN